MIRFKLAEMIERRQFVEGRRITINEVATATGLNRMTLSKILNLKGYGTGTDTIDRLCAYFNCSVTELMEYVPDDAAAPQEPPPALQTASTLKAAPKLSLRWSAPRGG